MTDFAESNLSYVEALFADYLADPEAVDEEWRAYFQELDRNGGDNRAVSGPSFSRPTIFNPPAAAVSAEPIVLVSGEKRDLEAELPDVDPAVLETRVDVLRRSKLFQDLPADEIELAARLADERRVADGTLLFRAGDDDTRLYLLVEGTLHIERRDGLVVALQPGDPVGELAVFTGEPRVADAVAHGDVRVLSISRQNLRALIEARPSLGRELLRILAERLRKDLSLQDKVNQLVHAYRVRGHLQARLDPLGDDATPGDAAGLGHDVRISHPELELEHYGLESELETVFSSTMMAGSTTLSLHQILERLRETYCRSIGVQFMHIDDQRAKTWLLERLEDPRHQRRLDRGEQLRIFTKLTDAELLEQFIHRKFLGAKRFSLEGAETLIPLVDLIVEEAGGHDVREIVFGMAHRGRLNVLVNILGKNPSDVFHEFDDPDAEKLMGRGDVKYHLGYSSDRETASGRVVHLSLCFNPSHLEFVGPVVLGRLRAKQDRFDDPHHRHGLAVIIHGDAAFAGQGVAQELFNLSDLDGYRTGGAVHIVVNNQIGFTTPPESGRSTKYATDIARMLQTPIFHVNGEDPEAVAQVVRLAMDYRREFQQDVIIDMYCYRRYGHNEGDEPAYTQPLLYEKIRRRKSVREGYLEHLLGLGEVGREEADRIAEERKAMLENELSRAREPDFEKRDPNLGEKLWRSYGGGLDRNAEEVETSVGRGLAGEILRATTRVPGGFETHKKLRRFLEQRRAMAAGEQPLDWAAAEALALGSLAAEGHPVRLSGQDSRRGTFSHRHAELHDPTNGETFIPLKHLMADQARLQVWDSPLSEIGVLGFEYGYSLDMPDGLTLWEAQFGDFCNVAQVIIDQFITSSEDKWGRLSGLVMLLPHGFEGQGPEHSSARLERFLTLAAEDNIQVVNLTTPAQLFHCLRRQVLRPWRKPLVVMSPKSLLRHPRVISPLEHFVDGRFERILPDASELEPGAVEKVLLTSGKLYYELAEARDERGAKIAILRLEQYYPLAEETLSTALEPYGEKTPLVFVQEEPSNMGALPYVRLQVAGMLGLRPFSWVSRPASASPATGSSSAHKKEQARLVEEALAT